MEPSTIIVFILLFILSAFFSGSEIAFMSVPQHKIDTLVKQRKFGARTLKKLKKNTDRLLITILIGNNIVNVYTSVLAGTIAAEIGRSSGLGDGLVTGIATAIITMMLLLFGEIMPKTFATHYAVPLSLYMSKIYYWLQIILKPLVVTIERIMKLFHRKNNEKLITVTPEEIEALVEMGRAEGTFDQINYKLIKNMLKFEGITAEEIMTPRVKIEAFSHDISVNEAIQKALKFSHSRIPVYQEKIDQIQRVITLRELLNAQTQGQGDKALQNLSLETIHKIPLTQPIDTILETFKHKRRHIAAIMDEYGGIAGLVTLEDVVEAVFGDILDETDKEIASIQKTSNGLLVQADITVGEMLEQVGLDYFDIGIDKKEFGSETISYFITSHLERFPKKNEKIVLEIQQEEKEKNTEPTNKKPKELTITIHKASEDTIASVIIKAI